MNFDFEYKLIVNENDEGKIKEYQMQEMFNVSITNKNILIFEPFPYHYECTSGFTKYFLDLGYKVDILMHEFGKDSLSLIEEKDKIRIFIYENLDQINLFSKSLIAVMNYYAFILVETVTFSRNKTISELELFSNNKSILVIHSMENYRLLNLSNVQNQNKIWTLGHFNIGLQVNPHHYGNIKIRDKNKRTKFFLVSTTGRNYKYIISAANKIIAEKLEFEINVVGHQKTFSYQNKKKNKKVLKNRIIYNYKANYSTLYRMVNSSDYIIMCLDPDKDHEFKSERNSGTAQLAYGFLKPVLINKYFKDNYNMTSENSFLFDKSSFYDTMKKAILLNNKEYKKKQKKLLELKKNIYKISILNVQKTLNSLIKKL